MHARVRRSRHIGGGAIDVAYLLEQLVNGLTLGAIYGLIAIGYTMVYGIVGMINFAHGEVYMIGAFVALITFLVAGALGMAAIPLILIAMLLVAMLVTAAYGWTIERVAYRPLRGSFRLAPLISAIGASIALQEWVRLTQGARNKVLPQLVPGRFELIRIGETSVTVSGLQVVILVTALALMATFALIIARTPLGRAQRACAQDKRMAALLGIDVDKVIATTFVMGAALAAVAGFLVTLYYGAIDFFIGFVAGVKAFTAAVLGGIGSLQGAMLGGLLIGLIEALWSAYFPVAYKDVAAFSILILVLVFRPQGLLGRPEVEKV